MDTNPLVHSPRHTILNWLVGVPAVLIPFPLAIFVFGVASLVVAGLTEYTIDPLRLAAFPAGLPAIGFVVLGFYLLELLRWVFLSRVTHYWRAGYAFRFYFVRSLGQASKIMVWMPVNVFFCSLVVTPEVVHKILPHYNPETDIPVWVIQQTPTIALQWMAVGIGRLIRYAYGKPTIERGATIH